jgi:hypothetical protein
VLVYTTYFLNLNLVKHKIHRINNHIEDYVNIKKLTILTILQRIYYSKM